MKRFLILIITVLTFFISCTNELNRKYDTTFINDSSIPVSFTIQNDDTIHSLQPSESCVLKKSEAETFELIDHPRVDINEIPPAHQFTFVDMKYKTIKVYNTSDMTITLTEKNGLLGNKYNDSLVLASKEKSTFKLYTNNPKYIATTKIDNDTYNVSVDFLLFYEVK